MRVRLKGIDAFERSQSCRRPGGEWWPCGEAARTAMIDLIHGELVLCRLFEKDKYGRWIGVCGTHTIPDLGAAMVAQGWALVWYPENNKVLLPLQQEAAEAKRGVWGSTFAKPWEYRHPVPMPHQ